LFLKRSQFAQKEKNVGKKRPTLQDVKFSGAENLIDPEFNVKKSFKMVLLHSFFTVLCVLKQIEMKKHIFCLVTASYKDFFQVRTCFNWFLEKKFSLWKQPQSF